MSSELKYVDSTGPTIEDLIEWMAKQSQSFLLDYGEDTGAWECSWIIGGQRYTSVSSKLQDAVWEALAEAGLFPLGGGNQPITIWKKVSEEAS